MRGRTGGKASAMDTWQLQPGAEHVQAEAQGGPPSTACEINEVMGVESFGKVAECSLLPILLPFLLCAVLPCPRAPCDLSPAFLPPHHPQALGLADWVSEVTSLPAPRVHGCRPRPSPGLGVLTYTRVVTSVCSTTSPFFSSCLVTCCDQGRSPQTTPLLYLPPQPRPAKVLCSMQTNKLSGPRFELLACPHACVHRDPLPLVCSPGHLPSMPHNQQPPGESPPVPPLFSSRFRKGCGVITG